MTSQELFGLAVEHQQAGRLGEAAGIYARILEVEPDHPMSLFHLGVICESGGDSDGAADLLTRALAAKPDLADARFSLGVVRDRQGRLGDARAAFEAVVAIAPYHFKAQFNLGLARQRLGDADGALAAYRDAVAIAPDHAEAHFLLGTTLEALGKTGSATASYRAAAALNPGDVRARLYLGNALQLLGEWDGAAEAYAAALGIKPDLMEASCNLAEVHAKQGDYMGAERLFTAAFTANPDHAVIIALKMLEWGVLSDPALREAIAHARRTAEPGDAAAASLTWFHAYRQGRLELACRLFDRFRARHAEPTAPFRYVEQKFLLEAWSTVRAGGAFFDALPPIDECLDGLPPLEWVDRHEPHGEYLICLPCDGVYWRRFGADVVRSIRERCSGAHLHVHLCDPGEGDIVLARSLGDAALPVDITTAAGPGPDCTDRQYAKTYYACIRFVRLYQLSEATRRPIMQIDVDSVVRRDFHELFRRLQGRDAGILNVVGRRGPFRDFHAAYIAVNPGAGTSAYLSLVARYIAAFIGGDVLTWMVDQGALYSAYDHLERRGVAPDIERLDIDRFEHCDFIARHYFGMPGGIALG